MITRVPWKVKAMPWAGNILRFYRNTTVDGLGIDVVAGGHGIMGRVIRLNKSRIGMTSYCDNQQMD